MLFSGLITFGQWSGGANPTLPIGQTVGVGTATPIGTMHLVNTGGNLLTFQRSQGAWTPTVIGASITGTGGSGGLRWAYSTDFGATFSDLLFMGNNGFVGINNPTPLVELDIDGKLRIRDIPTQNLETVLVVDSDGDVFKRTLPAGSGDADWYEVGTTSPLAVSVMISAQMVW